MSVARSYAKAWVETMDSRKEAAAVLDSAQAELHSFIGALRENRPASMALGSPATTGQEKIALTAAKPLKRSASGTRADLL